MNPDLIFLSKRWKHHTRSGGYDRASDAFGARVISRCANNKVLKLLRLTVHRRWNPMPHLLDYTYLDYWSEIHLLATAALTRPKIIHALYGDDQLDLILRWKRLTGAKLVASFHLPWSRSRPRFEAQKDLIAENLDAAVCVSSDLARDINSFLGREIAFYVPHGIDTSAFLPVEKMPDTTQRLKLLTVGFHMRDMRLIHRLADWASYHQMPVDFTYIGPAKTWESFTGCDNMVLKCNISEPDLIREYHQADALLLPVTSATANNALLEGIACGLPVISTNTGGIPDYLSEETGWLLPPDDEEALRDLVLELIRNRDVIQRKGAAASQDAARFDWSNTTEQLRQVYAKLLDP